MDWGSGLHDDICEKDYILRQLVAEGMMGMQEGMDLDKRLADRWDLCLCARREQSNGGVRAGAQQIWTYTQVIFREAKKMGQEQKPTTAEEWENLREKVIEFKSNVIDARDRFRMRGNR